MFKRKEIEVPVVVETRDAKLREQLFKNGIIHNIELKPQEFWDSYRDYVNIRHLKEIKRTTEDLWEAVRALSKRLGGEIRPIYNESKYIFVKDDKCKIKK